MDRDEKNRKLAEWVGWSEVEGDGPGVSIGIPPKGSGRILRTYTPDFFFSEDSSALLLEKMPPMLIAKCKLRIGEAIQWDVQIGSHHELHEDRKTAIAEAALQLAAKERK